MKAIVERAGLVNKNVTCRKVTAIYMKSDISAYTGRPDHVAYVVRISPISSKKFRHVT
jgi:hypothetical protein